MGTIPSSFVCIIENSNRWCAESTEVDIDAVEVVIRNSFDDVGDARRGIGGAADLDDLFRSRLHLVAFDDIACGVVDDRNRGEVATDVTEAVRTSGLANHKEAVLLQNKHICRVIVDAVDERAKTNATPKKKRNRGREQWLGYHFG